MQLDPLDLLNGTAASYGLQLARLWAAHEACLQARALPPPAQAAAVIRADAALVAEQQVADGLWDQLVAAARAAAPHLPPLPGR